MDFVMRIYLQQCKDKNINFLKLKYRVKPTATTRDERRNQTDHGNITTDWAGYADDLILTFEDQENLQKGLTELDELFSRYHLKINVSKTKTMIINHNPTNNILADYPTSMVTLHNKPIENVKQFRYLGNEIKFNEPKTGDAEINLRISLAENKFNELSGKFTNRKFNIKTRVEIMNSIVRSRLLYNCQTWSTTKQQMGKISSSYCKMLRRMVNNGFKRKVGTEFHYHYTNEEILSICKTESISNYISRQQAKYLAHIARKPNTSIIKRLHFNDNKTIKQGRPINTLETEVLQNLDITADKFYLDALLRKL